MGLLYVMCGIPGSGKTHYALNLHRNLGGHPGNVWYICPDEIRVGVNKNEASQANMRLVWDLAYFAIGCAVRNGESVILDATNAKWEDRQRLIDFVTGATRSYDLILYHFVVSLELAKSRNSSRTRVVPDYVLEAMFNHLKGCPPEMEEGWTNIRYITD